MWGRLGTCPTGDFEGLAADAQYPKDDEQEERHAKKPGDDVSQCGIHDSNPNCVTIDPMLGGLDLDAQVLPDRCPGTLTTQGHWLT